MPTSLVNKLACPIHKSILTARECQQTSSGVIKNGSLFCDRCNEVVAKVKYGKFDFLRVMPDAPGSGRVCDDFQYKRLAWSDSCVTATKCNRADFGWNAEGYSGCLQAGDADDWNIIIRTDATDVALRFLSHAWSGSVNLLIDDIQAMTIDLYNADGDGVRAYEIFRDYPGHKKITVKRASRNPLSNGDQIFFFGMDAVFSGNTVSAGGNRGNGFPSAYKWVLDHLDSDALVLDCGSGDRKFPDQRVVSFEYLPFELPDVFGDGHALPFADASFDAVFSQAVMEHMRDPYLAAREISRITKPGGLIYVESAFMQPLHAVPYHFFNTTPWGIQAIFSDAEVTMEVSEWFGPISASIDWYLRSCGGGDLTKKEKLKLRKLLQKVDSNVSYEQLKPIASAVSFWGIKEGSSSHWSELLKADDRPSFKYVLARSHVRASKLERKQKGIRRLRSAIKKFISKFR